MTEKTCFVICPIGKDDTEIRKWSNYTFNFIIEPIVKKYDYLPKRADQIKESGMITHQIVSQIIESPLVIADLTNANPNVYYELAIRHIVQKPYIQMIKIGQEPQFDISGMRTIYFDFDVELEIINRAKKELEEQIKSIEKGQFEATNPITLASNYKIVQEILEKNKNTDSENDASKLMLNLINNFTYKIDNLNRDVQEIKRSKNYKFADRSRNEESQNIDNEIEFIDSELNQLENLHDDLLEGNFKKDDIPKLKNEIKKLMNEKLKLQDQKSKIKFISF